MMIYRRYQKGAALLLSMIVLAVISVWAISICSLSDANVQLARNQQKSDFARASAESGLDILRFWLNRVSMPGTTAANDRFSYLADFIQADLAANGISNISVTADANVISFGTQQDPVVLNSLAEQYFTAQLRTTDNIEILQLDVTGTAQELKRTIRVNYNFGTRAHTVFDFGVATKGALNLLGNVEMTGANVELDSDVYIESENDPNALSVIGNSQIAGDVYITNPAAVVTLEGDQAGIGGETGQAAIDNHVFTGVPPTEFPVPDPAYFEGYVQNTYDPNIVLTEYENVRIPAGTDPIFEGSLTLKGVVFIEAPNVVTFSGDTNITGLIVGDGDLSDNSETNRIIFSGAVNSYPVADLPDEPQFAELKNETGTFLMAPGFSASFLGDFETLNGAIAANGITFDGDAGGTIQGTIINYSDNPMVLNGNTDLFLTRSGTAQMPAGFGPEIILYYIAISYSEVII